MGTGSSWFRKAIHGFRSFAYQDSPTGTHASTKSSDKIERPKIGLALGGGFARGIAHIGVLRVLEQHHIPVDFIAGTSVGALVAATYASGASLDEMERHGSLTKFGEIGPPLPASCPSRGFFPPVKYRDHFLVDGFLTETVPAPAVKKMGADVVI